MLNYEPALHPVVGRYYNGEVFQFEENHIGYCVCNTNSMIGENDRFLFFDLPPTTYQKVSDKTPNDKIKFSELDGNIFRI